jgi:hypothetical protein
MPRIVFFVLALFVLWRLLSAIGKRGSSTGLGADSYSRYHPRQRRRRMGLDDTSPPGRPEELLRCVQCGTYVPDGRALTDEEDDVFCSESCRHEHRAEGHSDA